MKKGIEYLGVISLFLLPGCFLAPHYSRPTVDTPPTFKEATPAVTPPTATPVSASTGTATSAGTVQWKMANPGDTLPHGPWWQMFGDPQLNALEQKVLISNQNVKQAEAQYRQARAIVSQTQSAYFPTVTTQPSVTRSLAPNISTRSSTSNSNTGATNIFDLPVTAAWEPDFWGAVTFAVRTAKAEAQASAAQLEGMRLSMQAELASDYFSLAAIDMETALLNSATDSYDKALRLTLARFNAGVASQTDVAQARTQWDSTHAQATDLGITRAQLEHAIAVLVGQSPATFSLPPLKITRVPPIIPVGLPSQLLERRPDIAAAERSVVAANGQIGLARAAYFPTLSLTATGGYESNALSNWITWPQRFWSIGASAAETLLDFGRRRAVAKQARALYDAQVAGYRQTVLAAFQEVEDNLAALRLLAEEAVEQDAASQGADQSLSLELERYKSGVISYLDIITTQNIALTNERASVQILGRRMNAAVTLIRAVGGGWDIDQLPWPDNLKSPPVASTAPVTSVAVSNPPYMPVVSSFSDVMLSSAVPAAVAASSATTPSTVVTSSATTPVAVPVTPVMAPVATPVVVPSSAPAVPVSSGTVSPALTH
jgi:NodT family efflux transporter outer membrane factor (OMF) lipoprotein